MSDQETSRVVPSSRKLTEQQLSRLHYASCVLLVLLIVLCVAWELKLAPLRPGGSWLVIKAFPLACFTFGVFKRNRRTYQALSLFIWLYFAEGMTRATSDPGFSSWLGWAEAAISLALFCTVAAWCRFTRAPAPLKAAAAANA